MLRSYEAQLVNGQLVWLHDTPPPTAARVIVTILDATPLTPAIPSQAFPLAGSVLAYRDPFEPAVPPEEWDCLK
jgi:hypothetical protein